MKSILFVLLGVAAASIISFGPVMLLISFDLSGWIIALATVWAMVSMFGIFSGIEYLEDWWKERKIKVNASS